MTTDDLSTTEPDPMGTSSFSGWHRAASAELRQAADAWGEPAQIIKHLDAAKAFEEVGLMEAENAMQRMLAMGLLMTTEGMRTLVTTGLETQRIH